MEEPANLVVLAAGDNVGIALRDIAAGGRAATFTGEVHPALDAIPQGHKLALADIAAEQPILRLGVQVGIATQPVPRGRLVHVHNVKSRYLDNDQDHYE